MSPVAVSQDRGEHHQAAGAITALNAKQPKQGRPRWRPFSFERHSDGRFFWNMTRGASYAMVRRRLPGY